MIDRLLDRMERFCWKAVENLLFGAFYVIMLGLCLLVCWGFDVLLLETIEAIAKTL